MAGVLGNLANVADAHGILAEARKLVEESLKVFDETGDQRAQGDLQGAQKEFEEIMEGKRKIGYQRGVAYDLSGISDVFRARGELTTARPRQEEALASREKPDEKHNGTASHVNLGILALEE